MRMDTVDLTELCLGLPPIPSEEVGRDNLLILIREKLGPENQVVLVQGATQTGKSNLLGQFARAHKSTSISYFITSSPWSQRPEAFLSSVALQAASALGLERRMEDLGLEELRALVNRLAQRLGHSAKQGDYRYYFIVDGIEHGFQSMEQASILDLLPLPNYPYSPYLVLSCSKNTVGKLPGRLNYDRVDMISFTLEETSRYLQGLSLSVEDIRQVHQKSGGIPGFLSLIRKNIRNSGGELNIEAIPDDLDELLGEEWERAEDTLADKSVDALNLLAASPAPLRLTDLSMMVSSRVEELEQDLHASGLIEIDQPAGDVRFSSELSREIANRRIRHRKDSLRGRLIEHFQKTGDSVDLLALLYKETGNYEGIAQLMNFENLTQTLEGGAGLETLIRRLDIACDEAFEHADLNNLAQWGYAKVILRDVSDNPVDEEEIRALISVGRTEEALRRIYAISDESMRLRLIARAYASIQFAGDRVPLEAKEEIEELASGLDLDTMKEEEIGHIAAELFPLVPDTAIDLLDRVVRVPDRHSAMDKILTVAALLSPQHPKEELISRIEDPDLSFLAKAYSTWLSGIPFESLDHEVEKASSTKAKEYLLRRWCKLNKSSSDIPSAVDRWLDVVVQDTEYVLPLRNLRIIVEILARRDASTAQEIIDRLEISAVTSLDSPKEELIRVMLGLMTVEHKLSRHSAMNRLEKTINLIDSEILELDTKSYCLARAWSSAVSIGATRSIKTSESKFKACFKSLLENSADQYQITNGTIRSLSSIDPIIALDAAYKLNTKQRRVSAVATAIEGILEAHGEDDCSEDLALGFSELDAPQIQYVLSRVLKRLGRMDLDIHPTNTRFLAESLSRVRHPGAKSVMLSQLASISMNTDAALASELVRQAAETWDGLQDIRARLLDGYEIVGNYSRVSRTEAAEFLDKVRQELDKERALLAYGTLPPSYVGILQSAIRALTGELIATNQHTELEPLILLIPALGIQVMLYGEMVAASVRAGVEGYARDIVKSKMLPLINGSDIQGELESAIVYTAPAIHFFDQTKCYQMLEQLPLDARERALHRVVVWTLAKCQLGDIVDPSDMLLIADFESLNKALSALDQIRSDGLLYNAARTISRVVVASYPEELTAPQALEIGRRLRSVAEERLPDQWNIRHEGYKILTLSAALRIRSAVYQKAKTRRLAPGLRKKELWEDWRELISASHSIENIADRAFVLTVLAEDISGFSEATATELLGEARGLVDEIPSLIDRLNRMESLASAYSSLGELTLTELLLQELVDLSSDLEHTTWRERVGLVVETAYKANPNLAAQLTETLDSHRPQAALSMARTQLSIEQACSNPGAFQRASSDDPFSDIVLEASSRKMLSKLVSGVGLAHHPDTILRWLHMATQGDIAVFESTALWATESLRRGGANLDLFSIFKNTAVLTAEIASRISPIKREGIPRNLLGTYTGAVGRMHFFRMGERDRALKWLKHWISQNASEYIKVCDPYFDINSLRFFEVLPRDCPLLVVTTAKKIEHSANPDKLKSLLLKTWKGLFQQQAPILQMIVIPAEHASRFHDRAIVTLGAGLSIGQSINGLGKSDGYVTELDPEEAKRLEVDYIDRLANQSIWLLGTGIEPLTISYRQELPKKRPSSE